MVQNIVSKASLFILALIIGFLSVVSLSVYRPATASAASPKCNLNITSYDSILYRNSGGGWYGYAKVHLKKCNFNTPGLNKSRVNVCKVDSRTNPRKHGPCYKNIRVTMIKTGVYDIEVNGPTKGKTPSAVRLVVIANPGDGAHYGFVTLRQK